jgi:hypothetical protein
LFTAIATTLLHRPHPPLASLLVLPGVASIIGCISGLFGSHFSRWSPFEPERLSITL